MSASNFTLTKAQAEGAEEVSIQGTLTGGVVVVLNTGDDVEESVNASKDATFNCSNTNHHVRVRYTGGASLRIQGDGLEHPAKPGGIGNDITLPNADPVIGDLIQVRAQGQSITFAPV